MPVDRTPSTSETLLRELAARPDSPRAEEFARLYEPVLRRYVAQSRALPDPVQPADRDDLVQEIFLSVRSAMSGFRYDPARGRFRAYLRTVVRNALLRFGRRRAEAPAPLRTDPPAPEPDREAALRLRVWTLALGRVLRSGRFAPNTVAAFRRVALEGVPASDVAREFKLAPNAVHQLKSRILRAVRTELGRAGARRLSLEDLCEALEPDALSAPFPAPPPH